MKKVIRFLFIVFTVIACSEKPDELPVVPFDNVSAIDLDHEIPLDSVVVRTEVIQFTADTGLIIGSINLVSESKDHFYLVADNQIMQFNKDGQLTNLIGRAGKGPGEYVGVSEMAVDELNQQIYVMDYFGRKMMRFQYDGTFIESLPLPENFSIDDFKLYKESILYTSTANSVMPELYIYGRDERSLRELSTPEREMAAGEGLMGTNCVFGNPEEPFLFHYFNDTVYSIVDSKLEPAYILNFGSLKHQFDELNMMSGNTPEGPRAQIFNIVQGNAFTIVRYSVTRLNGQRGMTFITGLYRNDFEEYSPGVSLNSNENPVFNLETGTEFYAGYDNSLLTIVPAVEALQRDPDFDISENDNSILLKYYLK